MFFGCFAIYANVIMYSYDSWEDIGYVIHVHLEDGLRHLESKLHVEEAVASLISVKYCEIG